VTQETEDKWCIKLVSLHAYIEMHGQQNTKLVLNTLGNALIVEGKRNSIRSVIITVSGLNW
jgi:hypothetical protein